MLADDYPDLLRVVPDIEAYDSMKQSINRSLIISFTNLCC